MIGHDRLHEHGDLLGLAHIGGHERDTFGERLGLGPTADHDRRAGVEEPLGDAPADAAGAAGDECDAAGEVEGHRHA